jgi:hypothetical protein
MQCPVVLLGYTDRYELTLDRHTARADLIPTSFHCLQQRIDQPKCPMAGRRAYTDVENRLYLRGTLLVAGAACSPLQDFGSAAFACRATSSERPVFAELLPRPQSLHLPPPFPWGAENYTRDSGRVTPMAKTHTFAVTGPSRRRLRSRVRETPHFRAAGQRIRRRRFLPQTEAAGGEPPAAIFKLDHGGFSIGMVLHCLQLPRNGVPLYPARRQSVDS